MTQPLFRELRGALYGIGIVQHDADLERIVDALTGAGIEVDADSSLSNVLVRPGDVARAIRIINSLGYETDEDKVAHQVKRGVNSMPKSVIFSPAKKGGVCTRYEGRIAFPARGGVQLFVCCVTQELHKSNQAINGKSGRPVRKAQERQ